MRGDGLIRPVQTWVVRVDFPYARRNVLSMLRSPGRIFRRGSGQDGATSERVWASSHGNRKKLEPVMTPHSRRNFPLEGAGYVMSPRN